MMPEKYPTWLEGHVKEWTEKRRPTVTPVSYTHLNRGVCSNSFAGAMEEFAGVKRRGMTPYRLHKRAVGENIGDASVKTSRDLSLIHIFLIGSR